MAEAKARHPLEPLDAAEVDRAVQILKAHKHLTRTTRIISIMLREPSKKQFFANSWAKERHAEAVIKENADNTGSHVLVNLVSGKVVSVRAMPPGAQPTLSLDEMIECEEAVKNSDLFKQALLKHFGSADSSLVMVDIWSAGNYGDKEDSTRRLARPLCFFRTEPGENGYAHPIEGLRPVVDLNNMQVIRVEDYGKFPLPKQPSEYAAARVKKFRTDLKPLVISQPEGGSFKFNGRHISWQNWEFVIGFNAREGLTLHDVRYQDRGRSRPILYRVSLTEMVVPYGDPQLQQVRKNAFDVGEYGMGMCANTLKLGCDCKGNIQYFDAHLVDSRGRPFAIPNAICVHEEDAGILWKHTDRRLPDAPEVRRSTRLVISSVSTVENYEYGFFWYFYQDGNIGFETKLSGSLSLGVSTLENPVHGALCQPQLYAPNHQHFFNVKLVPAIDGPNNTVQQLDISADPESKENPFHNAFRVNAKSLKTETQAKANLCLETGRTWKFINPNVKNHVGQHPGYKFFPGDNAVPFASKNAWWRKRAGFVDHHVWVTPENDDERYAAGDYPNQSAGGDGLIKWTAANRNIDNTDVVFWYTYGHTHIPRPEDAPVMPVALIGFMLKPSGFFHQNPGNDVPPSDAKPKPQSRL